MSAVLMLVNGPGELWSLARPLKRALDELGVASQVFLLPCQFASGVEREVASSIWEEGEVIGPLGSWGTIGWLGRGRGLGSWRLLVQLGGDPLWGLLFKRRMGAELWRYTYRPKGGIWGVDRVFSPAWCAPLAERASSVEFIGDLVLSCFDEGLTSPLRLVLGDGSVLEGLRARVVLYLPGSRWRVREKGLAFLLEVARVLRDRRPGWGHLFLLSPFFRDEELSHIRGLISGFPLEGIAFAVGDVPSARGLFQVAVTQPGTNTLELMYSRVPAVVLLPLEMADLLPRWGFLWALGGLPLLGGLAREILVSRVLRLKSTLAWPNRIAGEEIFPELVERLSPSSVADFLLSWCEGEGYARALAALESLDFSGLEEGARTLAAEIGRRLFGGEASL